MPTVWDEIEKTLTYLYNLPHNRRDHLGRPVVAANEVRRKMQEIRSGVASLTRHDYVGPRIFLRAAGTTTHRIYSGEWWFDVGVLDALEAGFSRIYFNTPDKRKALRDMLRELLAISLEWNQVTELWALELPHGQTLRGYAGSGKPQKLFADLPLSAPGNRMLVGHAEQVCFPVKNPLWVKEYRNLL